VLVVEDDTILLMDLEMILREAGAEIVGTCRTGEVALATVRKQPSPSCRGNYLL
jgi:CheY-like chemotaxis protein